MVILYKLTSRSRPAKMYKAYKSVVDNAVLNWVMILSVDTDDSITLNSDEFKQIQWDKRVSIHVGTSKNKVDAINRDVPESGWDILVNLSDDQIITVKSFDTIIAEHCGNDYTATTGTTVTLTEATIAGDLIEIFAQQLVQLTI